MECFVKARVSFDLPAVPRWLFQYKPRVKQFLIILVIIFCYSVIQFNAIIQIATHDNRF